MICGRGGGVEFFGFDGSKFRVLDGYLVKVVGGMGGGFLEEEFLD